VGGGFLNLAHCFHLQVVASFSTIESIDNDSQNQKEGKLKKLLMLLMALSSSLAIAHPNGLYEIDGDRDVTVEFQFLKRCPTNVEGALRGGLRLLTFSEKASVEPYLFATSHFVEIHTSEGGEVYLETDQNCVPIEEGQEIPADRNHFADYSLKRIR